MRYLSREAFADTVVDFERAKAFYAEKSALKDRVEQLEDDILILSKFSPFAAVNYIRKAIGYEDYIRQYADEKKQDKASLMKYWTRFHKAQKRVGLFRSGLNTLKHIQSSCRIKSRIMQVATEAETAWTVSPSAPCMPQRGWSIKKFFLSV